MFIYYICDPVDVRCAERRRRGGARDVRIRQRVHSDAAGRRLGLGRVGGGGGIQQRVHLDAAGWLGLGRVGGGGELHPLPQHLVLCDDKN